MDAAVDGVELALKFADRIDAAGIAQPTIENAMCDFTYPRDKKRGRPSRPSSFGRPV